MLVACYVVVVRVCRKLYLTMFSNHRLGGTAARVSVVDRVCRSPRFYNVHPCG